jgi:hypothetical protein
MMADSITYTYTGNDFTSFSANNEPQVYTTRDFVSVEFTLSAPLAHNLTPIYTFTPVSFSFSDGVDTIDSTSPNLTGAEFEVETDASGDITAWIVYAENQPIAGGNYDYLETLNVSGDASDFGLNNYYGSAYAEGYNQSSPGTFVESAVVTSATPEPTSLMLVVTGLIGAAGLMRRRMPKVS